MIKKTFFPFLCLFLMLIACGESDEDNVEFQTITTDKKIKLSNEEQSPSCTVHLQLEEATKANGHRGEVINTAVMKRLLDEDEETMELAADAFAYKYISSYKKTMLPLYNEDRADTTKRSWYEYHYVITSSTQKGSKGTLVYLATIDYYEGGAHGINQHLTAKTGCKTMRALRDKGYLYSMEMFPSENFILGDETITFVYNPYEIAPYAVGSTELIIPFGDIKDLLKNSFEY